MISANVDNRLRGLSLFSGIGGIDAGLSQWVRTVAYCEADVYCQRVLCSRMADGALDRAPIWDDVRTLRHQNLPEPVDIIFGGFPCQDISSAGRGAGLAGGRSGLYWELWRLVAQHRPPFVFLENVPAIRTRGLDVVASSLSGLGYDLRWTTLAASDVGAPHRRQRWFCLAFSADSYRKYLRVESRRLRRENGKNKTVIGDDGPTEPVADSDSESRGLSAEGRSPFSEARGRGETLADSNCCPGGEGTADCRGSAAGDGALIRSGSDHGRLGDGPEDQGRRVISGEPHGRTPWWSAEPDVGGAFDGLSAGMDRSGGLGNAEAEETGANEVMRYLREDARAETLQWATRGLDLVSATSFLFSFLCEYEVGGRIPRGVCEGQKTPEGLLRAMRENREPSCAPCRRRPIEQFFREYPDAMRELSQLVASRGETPWSNPLWEGSVSRIDHGVPHRVDRVRCLGNAVVPAQVQAVYWFLLTGDYSHLTGVGSTPVIDGSAVET